MESSIKNYITMNKDLFTDVQASYSRSNSVDQYGKYTILDYDKIMESICDYIDGYLKYKEDDDDRYRGKINASTEAFYNKMFTDTAMYRKTITLAEFTTINKSFLEWTKKLQDKIQELDDHVDYEAKGLAIMTDRQYKKLGKVMRDDMYIYMWKTIGMSIDNRIKIAFDDRTTPVMHRERS